MQTRQNALTKWLEFELNKTSFSITPLAGDASFRRYFRLHDDTITRVVMDAPPEKETMKPFLNIAQRLKNNGIHTPNILAVDEHQGFMLLEDFGDQLLLHALTPSNADRLYHQALETLLLLQQCPTDGPNLPIFDQAFMFGELALFQHWFLENYLNLTLTTDEIILLQTSFDWLTLEILKQPQRFIHRDYHARNLMLIQTAPLEIGVIDFQDAMIGPLTYDLVSLLKDCYIQWPRDQVIAWVSFFYNLLPKEERSSLTEFIRLFDLTGLQRHLKVLGIFCRLHFRDHKSAYLRDLPLTFEYTMQALDACPELHNLYEFMKTRVYKTFMEKQAS